YTEIVQNSPIPNEATPNAINDQPPNSQADPTSPNQAMLQTEKIIKEFSFVNFETIKPSKSHDQIQDKKYRTIQVLDIPLKINTSIVRKTFTFFGNIVKLTM